MCFVVCVPYRDLYKQFILKTRHHLKRLDSLVTLPLRISALLSASYAQLATG